MNARSQTIYIINIALLVLVAWCIPWWIYNRFIRTKSFHPMGKQVLPTPRWMACAIPYVSHDPKKNKCENVKFDGWTLGHVAIYFTLGMFLPGYWIQILLLSIACEVFEYIVGWRARWIIDPLANVVGYLLGHVVYINLRHIKWIWRQSITAILIVVLCIILLLNRPTMIPGAKDFY